MLQQHRPSALRVLDFHAGSSAPVAAAAMRARSSRSNSDGSGTGWGQKARTAWWGATALFGGGLALSAYAAVSVVECEADTSDEVVDISKLQNFDRNWDGRHPKEGEHEPTAYRYIVLIRHGQYNTKAKNDADAILTAAGRQQAQVLAQKLVETYTPNKVIRSEMTRAKETFDIVMKKMPKDTPVGVIAELKEGRPCQPTPPSASGIYKKKTVEADGQRIDEAFDKIFYRAPVTQKEDSYDVVVCHANVIRYFVCKALQVPTEAWLRMSLSHCSTTVIRISPRGTVSLRELGNTHYLPPHLITSS